MKKRFLLASLEKLGIVVGPRFSSRVRQDWFRYGKVVFLLFCNERG